MKPLIVTTQPGGKIFMWIIIVLSLTGLYGLTYFSPRPLESPWVTVGLTSFLAALLGFFIFGAIAGLQETSYFIVLKEDTLGINESGYQRFIPLQSITEIKENIFSQNLIMRQHHLMIHYQYQGQVKMASIINVSLFGFSLHLRHFEPFIEALKERKAHISTERWAEATEKGGGILTRQILLIILGILFTVGVGGGFIAYNEFNRILVESSSQTCIEIVHGKYGRGVEHAFQKAVFHLHGKRVECAIKDMSVRIGDTLIVEHWRGALWGEAYITRAKN